MTAIWEHKGYKISVSENSGNFIAKGPGQDIRGPSLDAVRKKIDKLAIFEPFAAITDSWGQIKDMRIVGVEKPRGGYRSVSWKMESGGLVDHVIRDTPENRAKLETYLALAKTNNNAIERLKAEIGDARDALPFERPT